MVFSTPVFLFGFLPLALLAYYLSPRSLRNKILLISSLLFYAWGEVFYLGVMLASIGFNYVFGRLLERGGDRNKLYMALALIGNVGLLISYKYANFITDNINRLLALVDIGQIDLVPVHLPLGISFFTFQAISYIVDIYRKEVRAQHSVFDLAMYISMFPQLIAGPIVRYHDIAAQIDQRVHSVPLFASGCRRFVYGLAKKILIANSLGEAADKIFDLSGGDLTLPLAWLGILAYTLQIYFDFSGYSDMAIGLGRMFGFRYLENFNYPYISRSVREFWRRWHISLSTWFRDYVYIALGGNRVRPVRVYLNLLLVFVLTGFWHGASWNFLVWGLFHGLFLACEHAGMSKLLNKLWSPLRHLYVLLVVIVGWVFFRADDLPQALAYLTSMFDIRAINVDPFLLSQVVSMEFWIAMAVGILIAMPLLPKLTRWQDENESEWATGAAGQRVLVRGAEVVLLLMLCMLSLLKISASTYNPFIYFRF